MKDQDKTKGQLVDELVKLRQRIAEIEVAEDECRRAEEALRSSAEKLKFFAYSIIHDLKSPTIGIYGLTELLHKHYKHLLDERGQNCCDQILKATVHVAALLEKINVYIEVRESPLSIEESNVKEMLQTVREEFSPRLTVRQIEWLEPEIMPVIKADKLAIIRVFRNLVDNALKYGGEDLSEIKIGYEESEKFHTLSISDDGTGIREGEHERIFAAFRRGETYKTVDGVGLGLAIVREIAERHSGKVWVEPSAQKGTTFPAIFKNIVVRAFSSPSTISWSITPNCGMTNMNMPVRISAANARITAG